MIAKELGSWKSWCKRVDRLNPNLDKDLIKRIDDIAANDPTKLGKLDDLYSNMKAPVNMKGKGDFTVQINGQDVYYDKNGFPDFRIYSAGQNYAVKNDNLVGRNPITGLVLHPDFDIANQELIRKFGAANIDVRHITGSPVLIKIDGQWKGPFTWHHHQDGRTLVPVLQSIHIASSHSGGADVILKGLQDLFASPY